MTKDKKKSILKLSKQYYTYLGWYDTQIEPYLKSCVYIGNVNHDVTPDILGIIAPYVLTLANINDPISVASPKVAKASK